MNTTFHKSKLKTLQSILKRAFPLLLLILIVVSCNTTKYAAVPCPDLPLKGTKSSINRRNNNKKLFASSKRQNNRTTPSRRITSTSKKKSSNNNLQIETEIINNQANSDGVETKAIIIDHSIPDIDIPYEADLQPQAPGEATNISIAQVTYMRLEPIPREASLGSNLGMDAEPYSSDLKPNPQFNTPQIEALGLAGFISGIVGLFVLGIPLGILATVFGAVSLTKIKNNPEKHRGRGFAIASLVLGIIDIVALILVIL